MDITSKSTGDSLTAAEFNQVVNELEGAIQNTGMVLSSGDLTQLSQSIANYVANGGFYVDSGAADTYVLSAGGSKKGITGYQDGQRVMFKVSASNTGASTVNVNSLGAKAITDIFGVALTAGQLATNDFVELVYVTASNHWRIFNSYIIRRYSDNPMMLRNVGMTVAAAAGAMTITLKTKDGSSAPSVLSPVVGAFRDSTLTIGRYVERGVTSALSLVLSSGSTLGTLTTIANKLYVYLIDNAGTLELAASRYPFKDQSVLYNTTAEGGAGGADTNNLLYSTTARTNVAIRMIGYFTAVQTGGSWANPTVIFVGPSQLIPDEVVGYRATTNTARSMASGGFTTLITEDIDFDPFNALNVGTGVWPNPVPGYYQISGAISLAAPSSGSWADGESGYVGIKVGGTSKATGGAIGVSVGSGPHPLGSVSSLLFVPAGSDIAIFGWHNEGAAINTNSVATGNFGSAALIRAA